ncbi:phospholipid phosphatase-related protein type 2 isoform X4 [Dasypus novemcinctus]|uniref:phospholipid phosphatase-related protein type 2 isoform X4 n=1 Tax=Dasypus novemcinctus TaxID=9361 RepID=UPI00265D8501|nr:phospholipid phosphatase-related protein type 2 isoform X4 [Dasypus novemcinctus]
MVEVCGGPPGVSQRLCVCSAVVWVSVAGRVHAVLHACVCECAVLAVVGVGPCVNEPPILLPGRLAALLGCTKLCVCVCVCVQLGDELCTRGLPRWVAVSLGQVGSADTPPPHVSHTTERAPQQGRWTQAAPCLLWPGSQWLCPVPWGSPSRWPPAAAVTLRGWRRRLVGSPRALWQRPTPSAGLAFTMAGGRPQPKRSFSIIPCFVFVESVLLGFVVLLAYRLEFTDTFTVHAQGFFCYDSTYAKPYPGPEAASRAPPALVYALVTAGPTLTILLGELARAFFPAPPSAISTLGESTIVSGACCRFSPPLRRLVRFLGGDGQPHAALPVRLPPQLHGPGLPAALARPPRPRPLRHRPGRLRRQPQPGGRRAPRLPLQGRGALRLRGHLHGDVRDPRVPREGLPPGQAVALPGPAVSCLLGGRGAGGRVPQPLVRRAGRLPDRSGHRRLPGHLRRAQLPEQATLWPEALPVGEPGPGPLRGQPPRKEPEACRPHSTPARLTPSKPQNCARRGHLIPSCVSSRAPAMCSSPRVPRPRLRSEPTPLPLPLPLPLPAPTPGQGPSPSSPGPGGPGGGGGRGRKLLLPTPLLRDLYTLSGLYPSPFHRDNFSPYLFASRDHLL